MANGGRKERHGGCRETKAIKKRALYKGNTRLFRRDITYESGVNVTFMRSNGTINRQIHDRDELRPLPFHGLYRE